jgi:hypothetical protein
MKPAEALKDDLLNFIGRMREEQYPELTPEDVLDVLRQMAISYRMSEWEAANNARWECNAARKLSESGSGPKVFGREAVLAAAALEREGF